jgi:hypothetical protein
MVSMMIDSGEHEIFRVPIGRIKLYCPVQIIISARSSPFKHVVSSVPSSEANGYVPEYFILAGIQY